MMKVSALNRRTAPALRFGHAAASGQAVPDFPPRPFAALPIIPFSTTLFWGPAVVWALMEFARLAMLSYDEFRAFYDDLGIPEDEGRKHFEQFVDAMDCLLRTVRQSKPSNDLLWIDRFIDSFALGHAVESNDNAKIEFEAAANPSAAGRKRP